MRVEVRLDGDTVTRCELISTTAADVPAGWRVVFGGSTRTDCLAHIEVEWADLRPRSLRESVG